jgi:TatD DNase family protein
MQCVGRVELINTGMIETHAHLYDEVFEADIVQVIKNAKIQGIQKIIMPNVDEVSIARMLNIEAQFPDYCMSTMGLHPCYVKENWQEQIEVLRTWLTQRKFVAIGECGIDLYWDKTTLSIQQQALEAQCQLAVQYQLPLILHTREAFYETYEVVSRYKEEGITGVFHCFSDSVKELKLVEDLGFKIGLGGAITYKKVDMNAVIQQAKPQTIVIETDAPYLTPVPYRGKRNEPSYIQYVVDQIARILNQDRNEIITQTTLNAKEIFYGI